jgi:hypothetical protein
LEQITHSAARRPPHEAVAWCAARVDSACAALLAIPEESLAVRCDAGLAKLRKRVRSRFGKLKHRREEDFHEARKALKAWLGALGCLPDASTAADSLPVKLADWLGDENDLATLGIWLNEHGFTSHFVPDLWETLASARSHLQEKVLGERQRLRTELKSPPPAAAE